MIKSKIKPFMAMRLSVITISLLLFAFASSCSRVDVEEGTPACVEKKIKDFSKSSSCNDAHVDKYTFQGNTVYVFEEGLCGADFTTEVIDSDCNALGSLGGIAGITTINGEDFSNAILVKTIWEK